MGLLPFSEGKGSLLQAESGIQAPTTPPLPEVSSLEVQLLPFSTISSAVVTPPPPQTHPLINSFT